MRKVLLSLLLIALLAIFGVMVISGINIGNLELGHSIRSIINKNNELDQSILGLSKKIDTEYAGARTNLDQSFKKLQAEKQSYQSTVEYTSQEDIAAANQTEEYKLDYLWTKIGLYATNHNVAMKADLSYGSSGVSNQYNISFTATGEYLDISEFVYEIEKDSSLGFRIEEFALVPYSEESLQATFIIKNVSVDPASLSKSATVTNGTVTDNSNTENSNDANGNTNTPAPSIGGVTAPTPRNTNDTTTNDGQSTMTDTTTGDTTTTNY